ncbi:MAG: hypothetical protein ACR2QX_06760 [Woeseiaceae bacterium]
MRALWIFLCAGEGRHHAQAAFGISSIEIDKQRAYSFTDTICLCRDQVAMPGDPDNERQLMRVIEQDFVYRFRRHCHQD